MRQAAGRLAGFPRLLCVSAGGAATTRLVEQAAEGLHTVRVLEGVAAHRTDPQTPPESAVAVPLQEALLEQKSQVILELQNAGDKIEEVIARHRHEIDNDLLEMVQRRLDASIRFGSITACMMLTFSMLVLRRLALSRHSGLAAVQQLPQGNHCLGRVRRALHSSEGPA